MRKLLIAAAVAALAVFAANTYTRMNLLNESSHHYSCLDLSALSSSKVFQRLLRARLSTQGLKFPEVPSFCDGPGKMYVVDMLHPKPTPVELQIKGELDLSSFNPHGISVYTDEADDSIYVFVVNHPHSNSQIEIFRFAEEDTLVHLKTISHPLLPSVNDIVAVGKESFYASNDQYFPSRTLHLLTLLLGVPMCEVVYYSPGDVRVVAGGILSGNGINLSLDKRYIYVSDIADHDIDVFERKKGEQLVYIKSVAVGSLCDNIEVDHRTGDLWMGCHPNPMKLFSSDPKDPPGSEIIRIQNIHSQHPVVTVEYVDDGHVLMGSTVAAPYEGRLLVGTIFHKALYCDLR
uniref:Paraoxonase n=1 Tax=Stegastes partitus TaxID=144197 RepID=A0A3B4Z4R6_9TELE